MRHGPRAGATLLALTLALGTGSAGSAQQGATEAVVHVEISGLRNAKGVVRACMTSRVKGFPQQCRADAQSYTVIVPAKETVSLEFDHVRPGRYAIALLHDENNNGKADRALSMIPKEGFGFSRDAPVRMGPPSFDSAAFSVVAGSSRQAIRMRYML